MGLLIGIVVLGLAAYGVLGLGFLGWASSKEAKTRAQAPQILDDLFDGEQYATYRIVIGSLPFETVVIGAKERGYGLMHETDEGKVKVLVFELKEPDKVPQRRAPALPLQQSGGADRTGGWLMALGVGVMFGGLFFAAAIQQVAAIGYVASFFGVGLVLYGSRERRETKRRAHDGP